MRAIPTVTLAFALPVAFAPFGLLAAQHLSKGTPVNAASGNNPSAKLLTLNTSPKNPDLISNWVKPSTPVAVPTPNQTVSKIRRSPKSATATSSSASTREEPNSSAAISIRYSNSSSGNKFKLNPNVIDQVIAQSLASNPGKKPPALKGFVPTPVTDRATPNAQQQVLADNGNKPKTQAASVTKSSLLLTPAIAQNPTQPVQNGLPTLTGEQIQPQFPATAPPQVNPTQTQFPATATPQFDPTQTQFPATPQVNPNQTQFPATPQVNPNQTQFPATPQVNPTPNQLPATPQVNPIQAVNADEAYVLGPGDVIKLNFFNVPEYNEHQNVTVDGTINLPIIGNMLVTGMTLKQASDTISARYVKELEYPIVTVSLVQPRDFQIVVAGEISQPGLYTLPATPGRQFLTVVQVIQTAGGVTQAADLKRVEVRRPDSTGVKTITINLLELLRNGDISANTTLRNGDTIFIPAATQINLAEAHQLAVSNLGNKTNELLNVTLVGKVARPGPYKLTGQPTLIQALQQAGGITPSADLRQIQVRRQTRQGNVQKINIDLWQVLQTGDLSQDLVLQSGDTITIPVANELTSDQITSLATSSLSTGVIRVSVDGEVKAPGRLEMAASTTLNQAILAAGGINGRGTKKDVKLIRFNPNGTVIQQKLDIDLSQGLNPKNNPILQHNDLIVVGRSGKGKFTNTLSNVFKVLSFPLRVLF